MYACIYVNILHKYMFVCAVSLFGPRKSAFFISTQRVERIPCMVWVSPPIFMITSYLCRPLRIDDGSYLYDNFLYDGFGGIDARELVCVDPKTARVNPGNFCTSPFDLDVWFAWDRKRPA